MLNFTGTRSLVHYEKTIQSEQVICPGWEPALLHLLMNLTLSTTEPKVQCQIEQRAYIQLFAMRDHALGRLASRSDIGTVRRRSREVSPLKTENLTRLPRSVSCWRSTGGILDDFFAIADTGKTVLSRADVCSLPCGKP